MQLSNHLIDWNQELNGYLLVIKKDFLEYWKLRQQDRTEDDAKAAAKLDVQLISRVTTQNLPYWAGVEAIAGKLIVFDSMLRLLADGQNQNRFNKSRVE